MRSTEQPLNKSGPPRPPAGLLVLLCPLPGAG